MKPASTALKNTLQRQNSIYLNPRLFAEWEYNRFSTPVVTLTNAGTDDAERISIYGDTSTIVSPNRPGTGIAKARTGYGVKPADKYRDYPNAARFYPSDPTDPYKYWSSPIHSSLVKTNNAYNFADPLTITVMYPDLLLTNKIVVGFETSYARPSEYSVEVTVDGTNWILASSSPPLASDGTASLWYGQGGWAETKETNYPVNLRGVRLNVYAMNKQYAHLDVLQLGLRLEQDLSAYLMKYEVDFEVSSPSFIAPMGQASSNVATVQLSNIDGRFNNDREYIGPVKNPYFGLIDKKVKMYLDIGIDATEQSGSKYEYIREFTMWTDSWGGQESVSVSVDLKDSSVILQEMQMPEVLFQNATIGAVIWQIMDRVGMTNYLYTKSTIDYGQLIPFYWPKSDTSVWDELSELAETTQTAVFFDEYDILQIRARKAMYADKSIDWNFDAVENGQKLPDIVSLEGDDELEANNVEVTYQPAAEPPVANNMLKMETVWEPEEDTLVLRSSPLLKALTTTSTEVWVRQGDAEIWPYESIINISGEMLRYKGKEYGYYLANGQVAKKVINSLEEKVQLDAINPDASWKNDFTGKMLIAERGMFGSVSTDHVLQTGDYSSRFTNWTNTFFYTSSAALYTSQDGGIRQFNVSSAGSGQLHYRMHNSIVAPSAGQTVWYGMRFRFPGTQTATETSNWKKGGMVVAGDGGDSGYYFELTATSQEDGWEQRRWSNEVDMLIMPANGVASQFSTIGFQATILDDTWYDFEVQYFRANDGVVVLTAFLDGVYVGQWNVPVNRQPANEWRWGTYVNGPTVMDIDYNYAAVKDETDLGNPDNSNWLDLRDGGYTSGFAEREFKYNFRNPYGPYRWAPFQPVRISDSKFVFEEFTPQIHELRQFDIKFDENTRPVLQSSLYLSNEGQAEIVYYYSNAFGASFMLANASRENCVIKGEDSITFGSENTIDQALFVYGALVYQDSKEILKKTNDASIRKRGETKLEFESRVIQTKAMADEMADWIIQLWAAGVDELTMSVFGNPLVQLGDLVTVNFPLKGFFPSSHKYFVNAVKNTYDGGYTTSMTLRRAKV